MNEKALEILERATQVYMQYGVKSVTMDDLAKELSISKKTIYKYYSDKPELVKAIIELKVEMDQAVCINSAQQSNNAIEEMISISKFVIDTIGSINPTVFYDLQKFYPEAWKIIQTHKWTFVLNMITINIERGIKEGLYRENLNAKIIGKQYVVSNDMITNTKIFPWPEFKFEELFKEIMRFQLNGMVNSEGRKHLKEAI
ncbi:MAG: helix-turn-helix transcriptional regulator [Flavobacteriales bacterium]|nr:helix-turn-helix transcriptional regulator [Flavobacteriales bacterium]